MKIPSAIRWLWPAAVLWLAADPFCRIVRAEDGIIPASTSPPGGLDPSEVPQVILITFDDAVNDQIYQDIQQVADHQNPDGSPIAFTFFVSNNWTNYWRVHQLHAGGHEIAIHTITHSTGTGTDFNTWIREIEGGREALSRLAGVPLEEMRGFRAPYLAYNSDMFDALSTLGFSYDSSVPEGPGLNSPDGENYIWPYTLHDGLQQHTWTGLPPANPLPGLIEVPMWNLLEGETPHNMDPPGDKESLLALFKDNFLMRYEGNRVPVGIWLHATAWLSDADRRDALNEFLEWALEFPDVWVVGVGTYVDWVQNPVTAQEVADQGLFSTRTHEAVPEEETFFNVFSQGSFRSVGKRAAAYPTLTSAWMSNLPVGGVTVSLVVVSQWSTGFQAQVVVQHEHDVPLATWGIEFDPGDVEMGTMWGLGTYQLVDGIVRVTPGGASSSIAQGETVVATFGGIGDPDTLGSPAGSFAAAGFRTPFLSVERGQAAGLVRLRWDRTAPMYELQYSPDLSNGSWGTIQTIHGNNEVVLIPEGSSAFYRIRPLY